MARTQVGKIADALRGMEAARDAHGPGSAEYRRAVSVVQAAKRNGSYAQRYYGALEAATDPDGQGE